MNLNRSPFIQVPRALTVAAATLGIFTGACRVHAGFSLGDADNYGVLYEGNGGHQLQINNGPGLNGLAVNGNIGIGGTGKLQLSGPLVINGNVNFSAATPNDNGPYGGNIDLNGSLNGNVLSVSSDLIYLNTLSQTLSGETGTSLAINTSSGSQTINASGGVLDSDGNRVFNLSSMNFGNSQTLYINGDAAGDSIVININASVHFSGTIVLEGGLTSDKVLFNLTGGATLQTAANGETLYGDFLDPNGTINLNSVVIDGRVFGGDSSDMQIVSGAEINAPPAPPTPAPVPEPSTAVAGALLLLPLGVSMVKALRKGRGTNAVAG